MLECSTTQPELAQMFYASREYKRCSVDSGWNWILQAQTSKVAGAHWVCLCVQWILYMLCVILAQSITLNFFLSLSLSLPFPELPFFCVGCLSSRPCIYVRILSHSEWPFLMFSSQNFSLHRMQYAPTCPSISVLWDMRMTLARSGWSMTVSLSTDVIWVADDPESFRKRTSTFLCHSKLCFQPLLLCASLCLHTFMYLLKTIDMWAVC